MNAIGNGWAAVVEDQALGWTLAPYGITGLYEEARGQSFILGDAGVFVERENLLEGLLEYLPEFFDSVLAGVALAELGMERGPRDESGLAGWYAVKALRQP